jgi:hypothetical protein
MNHAFQRRVLVLPPGARCPYRPEDWRGAFVSVDQGRVALERRGRPPIEFRRGDLLWLTGLGLSAIHNPGRAVAVLTATFHARHHPRSPRDH